MKEEKDFQKKKEQKEKNGVIRETVKVVLAIYLIMAVVLFLFFRDDPEFIKDCFRMAISITLVHSLIFGIVIFIENHQKKVKESDMWAAERARVVKCSGANYIYIVTTVLLDFCMGLFFLQWYMEEGDIMIETFLDTLPEYCVQYFVVLLINVWCLTDVLKLSFRKVIYNRYGCTYIHFAKRKRIVWSELKQIKYQRGRKRGKLYLIEEKNKITLRSDIFCDGWEEMFEWVKEIAECYNILYEEETI